jgi:hypothetical protein
MGFNVGDKPNNISKNDFLTGLPFDLWGNYTFANGAANPATTGREMLLFFKEIKATETWTWVPTLNSLLATYGSNNFKIAAILYDSAGIIDEIWLNDQLSVMTVNFTVIMDATWASSITINFYANFGGVVTSPFNYLINKYCRIGEKTLGMVTGATIAGYLAGPSISTVEPSTVDPYHTLSTIGVTFSEAVLNATVANNYTLGGAGRGTIPIHPTGAALDGVIANKYNLTLGAGTPGNGNLSITISNITDAVLYTPVPLVSPVIEYDMDITPPAIGLSQSPSTPTNTNVTITAAISDASGIALQKYASGSQTIAYFAAGGTVFAGTTFTVSANGIYTVYAKDNAGNETVQTITVSNIDTLAPAVTAFTLTSPNPTNVNTITFDLAANDPS